MSINYSYSASNLRDSNLALQHGAICSAINQVFTKVEANNADTLFRIGLIALHCSKTEFFRWVS